MDKRTAIRKYTYILDKFEKVKKYYDKYNQEEDLETKDIIFSALQRVVEEVLESCIKLNIYVLKEKNIFPKSYKESFELLKAELNFDEEKINTISSFAKFRNILAHEYQEITPEMTLSKIKQIIDLLPEYLRELKQIL